MSEEKQPTYAALAVPAWVNGREVLLAVRKDPSPENRTVIAMFDDEARRLHKEHRLDYWTPSEQAKAGGSE